MLHPPSIFKQLSMKFLSRQSLLAGSFFLSALYGESLVAQQAPAKNIYPFPLANITLAPGSRLYNMSLKNADYLLSLEVDRMLFSYREFAGLDTKGAKGYGGWEWAGGSLRGEFAGHYIAACARMYYQLQQTDPRRAAAFLDKVNGMVAGLAACQEAISHKTGADYPGHPGYLNAQNASQFDRLETLQYADVPYYIIHKILAGLLDAYEYTHNRQALEVARKEAGYFSWRMSRLDASTIDAMLNTRRYTGQYQGFFMEFGGMQDALLKLYSITGDPAHLALANKFNRPWFTDMLASNEDNLGRNAEHSNSEVPAVVGLARNYAVTGNTTSKTAALHFLTWMAEGHEFSTGSISGKSAYPEPLDYGGELFNYPNNINYQVNSSPGHPYHNSGESCCSHNLNKLSDYAFSWTGDERWAGEYEKRFVNAVMAQQNPDDGMFIYNLNLKQGAQKEFGTPDNTFWCCYGSGTEAFAGLAAGVYYNDHQNNLWINRLMAGTLNWKEKGLQLKQETVFPDSGYSKISFTLQQPQALQLHVRIPAWATGATIRINGTAQKTPAQPGSFVLVSRTWKTGDVLELNFPFTLAARPMPDAPQYIAVTYGPQVLVNTAAAGATFNGTAQQLLQALQPGTTPCVFTAKLGNEQAVFKPINRIGKELYNGYTLISTPRVMQVTDQLSIGDTASQAAHQLLAINYGKGSANGNSWIDAANGWISFNLQTQPGQTMYLKCRYWGSDSSDDKQVRLFDIQVYDTATGRYNAIATQSLEKQNPGTWYDVLYPIPAQLTQNKRQVQIRFQAKGFYGKPGKVGGIYDKVQMGYYAE